MYRSILLVAVCCSVSAAAGTEQIVWQIGRPDHDYSEFACAGDYHAFASQFGRTRIVFEIGRSDPGRDWPYIQPGPVDSWSPAAGQPRTIRFQLSAEPSGLWVLRIEFADVQAKSPPRYQVKINGQAGSFQLQPGGGDSSLSNPRRGKPQKLELSLPATVFRRGVNEIQLTCTEGSWVQYDALTLASDPQRSLPLAALQNVTVQPTPLFVKRDGQIARVVDVVVGLSGSAPGVVLRVEAAGQTTVVPVTHTPLFGAIVQEVSVPDRPEPVDVKVTATLGSQAKTATVRVLPERKWRIFAAPSSHTDIGYTAVQPECAERHNQNIDTAIDLMGRYPDFHWNLEVAWQAENYVHSRQGQRLADFYRLAREGRLGVQALYCNMLTGLCSPEAACRLTWFAHDLCRREGIPFCSAMISDVPTQEASLPMLLANAGIRYFSSGINNDRAYTFTQMQEKCPCWWEGPDGSRVLMMYTHQYAQCGQWGLNASLEAARAQVVRRLPAYEARSDYPYDAIFLHGAVSDNQPLNERLPEVVRQWNERYAFPEIRLCHNAEFFGYVEAHYGDRLPVFRGSAGTYWEDGAGSSARETTLVRNAQESLTAGQTLQALAACIADRPAYQAAAIRDAWRNCLLYDEHTWGAHCSISQPDSEFTRDQWKIKAQYAVDASAQAKAVFDRGLGALAGLVRTDRPALVVFNPLSWTRTDSLRVTLPEGMQVADPAAQTCRTPQGTILLVKDVPACGYRLLELEPAAAEPSPQAASGNVIESRFYRVEFDPAGGAIVSVRDKESGRELVDAKAPYRLNQYMYVAGGDGTRIVMNLRGPAPQLTIAGPDRATLRRQRWADKGEVMTVESSGPMTAGIRSTVVVWNDVKRIDIENRLLKKEQTYRKEGVYFAFPFQAHEPTFRYEAPAAIVNANRDMLPGACLDWFTVQHFVEVADRDAVVTWATPDAPLVCFQDINRGQWHTSLPMHTGHLFAYVMNNYWHTNYKAGQGGDFTFRFSLTSRPKADNITSARFGWEASNPLCGVVVRPNPGGPLPHASTSLISVAEPNVLVTGAKLADDGSGLIVRLWELSGRPTTAHLRLDRHIPAAKAEACNLVEEPQGPLTIDGNTVALPVHARGLETVRILATRRASIQSSR